MKANTEQLARSFSSIIIDWIGGQKMRVVIEANKHETDKDCCHSHDYCDANQAMLDAFIKVHNRELDFEKDMEYVNAVWKDAKANDFYYADFIAEQRTKPVSITK